MRSWEWRWRKIQTGCTPSASSWRAAGTPARRLTRHAGCATWRQGWGKFGADTTRIFPLIILRLRILTQSSQTKIPRYSKNQNIGLLNKILFFFFLFKLKHVSEIVMWLSSTFVSCFFSIIWWSSCTLSGFLIQILTIFVTMWRWEDWWNNCLI